MELAAHRTIPQATYTGFHHVQGWSWVYVIALLEVFVSWKYRCRRRWRQTDSSQSLISRLRVCRYISCGKNESYCDPSDGTHTSQWTISLVSLENRYSIYRCFGYVMYVIHIIGSSSTSFLGFDLVLLVPRSGSISKSALEFDLVLLVPHRYTIFIWSIWLIIASIAQIRVSQCKIDESIINNKSCMI